LGLQNIDKQNTKKTTERVAKEFNISPKTVERAAKFASDIETIEENTGIKPQTITSGIIKATYNDIKVLASQPAAVQKEIIEKVEKKETNIKTAITEIIKNPKEKELKETPVETEIEIEFPTKEIIVVTENELSSCDTPGYYARQILPDMPFFAKANVIADLIESGIMVIRGDKWFIRK
jgi:hypothetical protein